MSTLATQLRLPQRGRGYFLLPLSRRHIGSVTVTHLSAREDCEVNSERRGRQRHFLPHRPAPGLGQHRHDCITTPKNPKMVSCHHTTNIP